MAKMTKKQALIEVCDFILMMELYSFQSLTETTQQKLCAEYGKDFGNEVNIALGF